jgi:hypothetical protein
VAWQYCHIFIWYKGTGRTVWDSLTSIDGFCWSWLPCWMGRLCCHCVSFLHLSNTRYMYVKPTFSTDHDLLNCWEVSTPYHYKMIMFYWICLFGYTLCLYEGSNFYFEMVCIRSFNIKMAMFYWTCLLGLLAMPLWRLHFLFWNCASPCCSTPTEVQERVVKGRMD